MTQEIIQKKTEPKLTAEEAVRLARIHPLTSDRFLELKSLYTLAGKCNTEEVDNGWIKEVEDKLDEEVFIPNRYKGPIASRYNYLRILRSTYRIAIKKAVHLGVEVDLFNMLCIKTSEKDGAGIKRYIVNDDGENELVIQDVFSSTPYYTVLQKQVYKVGWANRLLFKATLTERTIRSMLRSLSAAKYKRNTFSERRFTTFN